MCCRRGAVVLATLLLAPFSQAQAVFDNFDDGDFTHDPTWSGDDERFLIAVSDTLNWLRSSGLAESDEIHLSTASSVARGYWRFRFEHHVSLTNFNGSRIYLVAGSADLMNEVEGYYVQFGMNNLNRVELYRQDGPMEARTRLGLSEPIVPGDTNSVLVEVTRDDFHRWTVIVDGEAVIQQVVDDTYQTSAALGVWVRHTTSGRDAFHWTDFVADPEPGDITPPHPLEATTSLDASRLFVEFDEALDPESVTPDSFEILTSGVTVTKATSLEGGRLVRLELSGALSTDDHLVLVSGVADVAGNIQWGVELAFEHDPDRGPAVLAAAHPVSETEVVISFDRGVLACEVGHFVIEPGTLVPASIECDDFRTYRLTLGAPLHQPEIHTITASGFVDVTGDPQAESSIQFFFGEYHFVGIRDVVINEIMYAPDDVPSNEYVEILNLTEDRYFDLSELRLANATSPAREITFESTALAPGAFAVLVRNPEAFAARWPESDFIPVPQFPGLVNGGDTVRLLRADGGTVDEVQYIPSWGGQGPALERIDPRGASHHGGNWGDSQHPSGGTPGSQNSIFHPDMEPPLPIAANPSNDGLMVWVDFDEPLDHASVAPAAFLVEDGPVVAGAVYEEDAGFRVFLHLAESLVPNEYTLRVNGVADWVGNVTTASIEFVFEPDLDPPVVLEVRALSDREVRVAFDKSLDIASATDPQHYIVSDGHGSPGEVTMPDPRVALLELVFPMSGPATFELSIHSVSDEHGNVMTDTTVAFFYGEPVAPSAGDLIVSEIMHSPPEINSNEWVELANLSEAAVDLSVLTFGNQAASVPVSLETYLLGPGEYAVLVRNPAAFAESFPGVPFVSVAGFPTLLNAGDAVVIRHGSVAVDSVFYRPAWGGAGVSLERRSPDGPSSSPTNWASSLDPRGGTPGAPNSVPPDTEPPLVVALEVAPDGRKVVAQFDEPLDEATVTASNISISGVGVVQEVSYLGDDERAVLVSIAQPLSTGSYVLTVDGVADQLGNVSVGQAFPFDFEVDDVPPAILFVSAPDSIHVLVRFDEPVETTSASSPDNYIISPDIGPPDAATHPHENNLAEVLLHLGTTLHPDILYTLSVSGVADLAGNVAQEATGNFILGETPVPQPGQILLSEIMFNPADGGSEYVEVMNPSEAVVDLRHVTISTEAAPRTITPFPTLLLPGDYLAIARDGRAVRDVFGEDGSILSMPDLPSLRNTGDAVVLRVEDTMIDSVYYDASWHRRELRSPRGVALERIDFGLPTTEADNWTSSLHDDGGTPGRPNTVWIPPGEGPPEAGIAVHPSPFDAASGTVIRYRLRSDAGSARIRIFDGAGRLVRTLEQARLAGAAHEGEVLWNGRDDANQSLRIGIYVVLLEAIDHTGRRTETHRTAAVLARRFD